MRAGLASSRPARSRRWLAAAAAVAGSAILLAGCSKKQEEEFPTGKGLNASFAPSQPAACNTPDGIALFAGSSSGSIVNVNLTLTDCDGSLRINGVDFEIMFDASAIDFLGCSAGSIFPAGKLAPGTPDCAVSGGDLLGTVALQLPNSVQVSGGKATLVKLTFSVKQRGLTSPVSFLGTDSLQGTAVFFADPVNQTVTAHALGLANYQGGTFLSN